MWVMLRLPYGYQHYLNIFSFIRYLKNNTIIYYLVSVYTEEKLIFGMVAEKSKR